MASLEENIQRAIEDFDNIEQAIVESGMEVPDGTDTSEYADLIRRAVSKGLTVDQAYNPESTNPQSGVAVKEALESQPIKYIESLDSENYLNLFDLESGMYVLKGTFYVYPNATKKFVFSKSLFVAVSHGTKSTCVQVLYPAYNTIQYLNIWKDETLETGYDYERKDAQLYYAEDNRNKVTEINNYVTDEQYPSALAVQKRVKNAEAKASNAIKATASGEVIRVDDVSPVEHTAKVKVGRGRNIIPMPYYHNTRTVNGVTLTVNEDGSITLNGTSTGTIGFALFVGNMPLKGNYTLSGVTNTDEESSHYLQPYVDGAFQSSVINGSKTYEINGNLTQISLFVKSGFTFDNLVVYPQFEQGDTATEYEPYINPESVKVERCNKNILGFDDSFSVTSNGLTVDYDSAEQVFRLNGTPTTKSFSINFGTHLLFKPMLKKGNKYTFSMEYVSGTLTAESATNVFYLGTADTSDGERNNWFSIPFIKSGKNKNTSVANYDYLIRSWVYIGGDEAVTFTDYKFKVQLEQGDTATEYEPYNSKSYTPNADGTLDIVSVSPTMTLLTDTAGANIDVEYNQDSNAFKVDVKTDLKELDKVTGKLVTDMGDVETALDSIIAMQNSLIGGDTV